MGDRATLLPDGRFLVGARSDRVAKVGEKRVSLSDMEASLREHAWVQEAALAVLDLAGEGRIVAAVVLTEDGRGAFDVGGRLAVGRALAEHLGAYWDRVVLPRGWRYVERLPSDAQGKVTAQAVKDLFAAPPARLDGADGSRVTERTLRITEDFAALEGHFPGFPLVPGFVQIGWVMDVAHEIAGRSLVLERMEALKFTSILRPGDLVQLRVAVSASCDSLTFRLWNESTQVSSGRCRLSVPDAPVA
jgi:hypothetical protein